MAFGLICIFMLFGYGSAVPVRLEPYENLNEDPLAPKSSADSILNNVIIPDLVKAYAFLIKQTPLFGN